MAQVFMLTTAIDLLSPRVLVHSGHLSFLPVDSPSAVRRLR